MADLARIVERLEVEDRGEQEFIARAFEAGVLTSENAAPLLEAHREGSRRTYDDQVERETKSRLREKRTNAQERLPQHSGDLEDLRCLVLARHTARTAALHADVRAFRKAYFGAVEQRLPVDLVDSHATGLPVAVIRAARAIAPSFDWTEEQAARFLLSGYAPVPPAVSTRTAVNLSGQRGWIAVKAQPFAAPAAVASAFAAAQRKLLGHRRARPVSRANLHLFDYVNSKIVELGRPITKSDWRDLWKSSRSDSKLRRDSSTRMRRDYEATERRLLPASYREVVARMARLNGSRVESERAGLTSPGEPGQARRTRASRTSRRQ